jgi:heme exporter protein CcmD
MTSLFGTQYFGYILAAYGLTALALILLTIWIVAVHNSRKRQLDRLEESGLRRAARSDD